MLQLEEGGASTSKIKLLEVFSKNYAKPRHSTYILEVKKIIFIYIIYIPIVKISGNYVLWSSC